MLLAADGAACRPNANAATNIFFTTDKLDYAAY
jgi:hypothetical protein